MASPLAVKKGARITAAVSFGLLAVLLLTGTLACGDCLRGLQAGGLQMPSLLAAGAVDNAPSPARPVADHAAELRPLAQVEEALFVKGSLRGTEFPDWGTARGEPVMPNRRLRDRFDYYLLALGEASLGELTALVKAHAERDLGAATAAEVVSVWQHYLQLQQHAFRFSADPADPQSMQVALQEHRQVRQAILGVHWAQAFYGEEEGAAAADIERRRHAGGTPVASEGDSARTLWQPPPGTDPAVLFRQRADKFGAEAAQRLQALDEEEARWDQRIAAARAHIEGLRRDPGLSAPQRDDAIARHLEQAFPDASERLRANGLVGA
jgi:lipase chaperone LimK